MVPVLDLSDTYLWKKAAHQGKTKTIPSAHMYVFWPIAKTFPVLLKDVKFAKRTAQDKQ